MDDQGAAILVQDEGLSGLQGDPSGEGFVSAYAVFGDIHVRQIARMRPFLALQPVFFLTGVEVASGTGELGSFTLARGMDMNSMKAGGQPLDLDFNQHSFFGFPEVGFPNRFSFSILQIRMRLSLRSCVGCREQNPKNADQGRHNSSPLHVTSILSKKLLSHLYKRRLEVKCVAKHCSLSISKHKSALVFLTRPLYDSVMEIKKAVVLLSGGVDSSTTLAIARQEGYEPHALTFRYGQRHDREIEAANRVVASVGVRNHVILEFDLRAIGGSALTDRIEVPKARSTEEISTGIPVTYVPARNTIFLSFALALAERIEAEDIYFGANQLDYSGYPDCREEYVQAFERMANLATKAGVEGKARIRIHTPLIKMTKAEIIRKGLELGLDYSLTWSCYDPTPEGLACGLCDSCQLRLKGFREAGRTDPLRYSR